MTNSINRDNLIGVARKAESLTTMLADIEQDFFGTTDFAESLAMDANRLQRYVGMCFDLAHALTSELHKNGIFCYGKEVA